MPETPSIPPIDPEYIAEVKQLATEAESVLEVVARLTTRIGRAMEENDRLEVAVGYNDFAIDEIRAITGWDKLITTMYAMLGHVGAGADQTAPGAPDPYWYEQLTERRQARWAEAMA